MEGIQTHIIPHQPDHQHAITGSLSALASALLGPKTSPLASALHGEEEDR